MSYSRDSENDLNYNRGTGNYTPNILYGYTNSSIEDIQLYAWTSTSPSTSTEANLPTTFYTNTPNPTTNSTIYDNEGNDITSQVLWGSSSIGEATTDHITWSIPGPI